MGILSSLVEKRSGGFSVSDNLSDDHWIFRWLGSRTDAGVQVSETTILNTLAVVSAINLLADLYAAMPVSVYRRLEPRGRQRARNHSLYRIIHDQPNPMMDAFTYKHLQMTHLASWGNHYSEIERRRGEVAALWPFHPGLVRPYQRDDGSLWYEVYEGARRRDIPARDMLHLRGLSTHGLVGLSPLQMMRQAVGIAVQAERYGARFFANDARPSVLLKHPLTLSDTARKNLEESFDEDHRGAENWWRPRVLEEGMDIATVGIPPQDAQFLETRRFQVQEFARFYRIPPHLLADVAGSTSWGTGIEQQNIGLVTFTMDPWFVRAESGFNLALIPPEERNTYYTEFNRAALLRGDAKSRADYFTSRFQVGSISANDIRELENENPVPGGDQYFVPLNMVPMDQAGIDQDGECDASGERNRAPGKFRERRSATARRRIANSYRPVFQDTARRLLRQETDQVRSLVNRYLRDGRIEAFEGAVREFYFETFPPRIAEQMMPPVRSLVDAIAAEAAEEVGGDALPDEDLDVFARGYVDVYASRHAGDSRSRVLARIRDTEGRSIENRQAEELADEIDEMLDDWPERAEGIAEDEVHRGSNATAREVFGVLGVLALRWIAMGDDPCDYCKALNGRTASIDSAFLAAGAALSVGGGLAPLISQSSIGHPPVHSGCQCVIVPA